MTALLLDACLSRQVVVELRTSGLDVTSVNDWKGDPGDRAILAAASAAGRVLVALDKDFGEFAVLEGSAHAGIIRRVDVPLRHQAARCRQVLAAHEAQLRAGGIVTVEPTRVRVRAPP